MTSPVASPLLTAEEFGRLEPSPGLDLELVCGRVVEVTLAKTGHGRRGARIDRMLNAFAVRHQLGDTTGEGAYLVSRAPDTVRAPDAAFIANDRIPPGGIPDDLYIEGSPTLAVEVVSGSDREEGVAGKAAMWLAAGAERVWEVRPRLRTVTVHRAGSEPTTLRVGDTLTSDDAAFSVEGFELPLADIFA